MMDVMPTHPDPTRIAAFALVLAVATGGATGCGSLGSNTETQAIVTQRTAGMQAGVFFDRYGPWKKRFEQPGGGADYVWDSAVGPPPRGTLGPDDRICTLRLTVDKSGRIEAAVVAVDNPGSSSGSRCGEIFKTDGAGAAPPTGARP